MSRDDIKRMWINQPSTLQPLYKYHGRLVLVAWEKDEQMVDIWFVKGKEVSMRAPKISLSNGWPEHLRD